ncbi:MULTISPECIES: peptidoglycan-binding domain-containing protein [unclassified Streptomyces]|uniref:peptidoglycan-binding domain-containing protein n=1 Tax=unclassified Streptomyces TaxID=2593676 RepID=UPI002DDC391A|nr:peptidoglycan-binding domain-containing protein [Streptomyces sp. NBC_00243]WRZ17498.1 peptidoglycan-binding protein [Streptomyces sp. NBC_00243]
MSTPPERGGQPVRRPALEPTYVQRRRRTEALAELLREFREDQQSADVEERYESIALPRAQESETEELPPVLVGEDYAGGVEAKGAAPLRRELRHDDGREKGLRRAAVVVGVAAAALTGFALALLLPGGDADAESQSGAVPSATAPVAQAPSRAADPDGAGTLREGDSGAEVTELQERLLNIPDVYADGTTSGTYDPTLTAAVARFQLWYGIRGDETGVYGNDTRAALESRT